MNRNIQSDHVDCLDGLRGIASIWVFVGHAAILTGVRVWFIDSPGLAVDLFITLSGFLMAFHYRHRREAEPWESPYTWSRFWIRRFFRIAPLFYALLIVAYFVGPILGSKPNHPLENLHAY